MINLIIGIILFIAGIKGIIYYYDYFSVVFISILLLSILIIGIIMIISSIIIISDNRRAKLEENRYKDEKETD